MAVIRVFLVVCSSCMVVGLEVRFGSGMEVIDLIIVAVVQYFLGDFGRLFLIFFGLVWFCGSFQISTYTCFHFWVLSFGFGWFWWVWVWWIWVLIFFLSIVVEKSSKEMERKREKAINELKNE